jgi:O-antigen/teichoic acid export membrane protein
MNVYYRLIKGIGANTLGLIVTIIIQIIQVPLYLTFWGITLYGEWLILYAIPSYLLMSDIGFGNVAANEMTRSEERRVGKECTG